MSQQINLYQAKFRKQRKPLSAREAALGMLLVAAVVAANAAWLWQKNDGLARQVKEIEAQVAEQKSSADRLTAENSQRKKDAQLEASAQRAEQQVAATRDVMQLINGGTIGVPNGYSEQLRALARQALVGMWLTGFTLAANADENLIRGRTLDAELVPAYLRRLNGEPTFQGQHFDALTISTPAEAPPPAAQHAAQLPAAARPTGAPAPKAAPALKFLEFSVGAAKAAALQTEGAKP
jgi:cell division protein FtsL